VGEVMAENEDAESTVMNLIYDDDNDVKDSVVAQFAYIESQKRIEYQELLKQYALQACNLITMEHMRSDSF
jgi:hypothetical protein